MQSWAILPCLIRCKDKLDRGGGIKSAAAEQKKEIKGHEKKIYVVYALNKNGKFCAYVDEIMGKELHACLKTKYFHFCTIYDNKDEAQEVCNALNKSYKEADVLCI